MTRYPLRTHTDVLFCSRLTMHSSMDFQTQYMWLILQRSGHERYMLETMIRLHITQHWHVDGHIAHGKCRSHNVTATVIRDVITLNDKHPKWNVTPALAKGLRPELDHTSQVGILYDQERARVNPWSIYCIGYMHLAHCTYEVASAHRM